MQFHRNFFNLAELFAAHGSLKSDHWCVAHLQCRLETALIVVSLIFLFTNYLILEDIHDAEENDPDGRDNPAK